MTVEERIRKQQEEKLISLGYSERVYSDFDLPTDEYPLLDSKKQKAYKEVALPVTDEQFERIVSIGTAQKNAGLLPDVLKYFGIALYVVGFICGIIMGNAMGRYEFSFGAMIVCWAGSLATGLMFQWMGEMLRALRTK